MPRRPTPREVVMLAFPRVQVLDVTGPIEVFAMATRLLAESGSADPGYRTRLVARRPGPLHCTNGLRLLPDARLSELRGRVDTLMVAGGQGVRQALRDEVLLAWIVRTARRARRQASVCTGAFLLARAGLLDGRCATTHWAEGDALARAFPGVRVVADRIFVRDGSVYTSAGITAGMDLALALVEEDCGREIALAVARQLVLFLKRPGGQSQFSTQLAGPLPEGPRLRELQVWIASHPEADLGVDGLARWVGMSPRNFARVFRRELGVTPARYVERARLEAARRLLEDTEHGLASIAGACGFGSVETLRRSFARALKVNPNEYRSRFNGFGSEPQLEDAG